jgi:predicted enzyme related to lactoylglutathione lyase
MRLLVNVDVDDLPAAESFYSRALGLRAGRRFGADAVELLGFEAPIYLLKKSAGTPPFKGADRSRGYERHWTPVHLDFGVDDLDEAMRRAEAAGARREGGPKQHSWGRIAVYADPFGHGFCLIQFTSAGYDAIATG